MNHHESRRGRGFHATATDHPADAELPCGRTPTSPPACSWSTTKPSARPADAIAPTAGYRDVEQVTEPWDAVRRVRSFEPDVVLLDLHMPDPDGFEILRQLSAMASDSYLPVLVLTADTSIQNRERALGLGAADFLTKPYSMAETLLRVRNLVLVRRQHQELVRRAHRLEAEVEQANAAEMEARLRHRQISALIDDIDRRLSSVYQPIVDLATGAIVGAEALARFDAVPYRPPGQWFAEAAEVGLGTRLELAAASVAPRPS